MTGARAAAAVALLTVAGCARIEPPPGGPPDREPPRLIAVIPDSLAVLDDFDGDVEFRFDEVVSEGSSPSQGTGTGDLERLVILSPTTGVPEVTWRRSRITVRPREGWQPNRVYRVELLPGLSDLRTNRTDTGTVITFTTGAPRPTDSLRGVVVDWSTRRGAANAVVEAVLLPDSLPYRARADSSGRFSLAPLPAGTYLVFGAVDQNRNGRRDGREAFDSARVVAGRAEVPELWTFVHDTTAPRAQTASVNDSTSAMVTLSQPLQPGFAFPSGAARVVLLPDSAPVPVVAVSPKSADDSLVQRQRAATDTAARREPADTSASRRGAERQTFTARPQLEDRVIVRVQRPWSPGARYAIEIRGVRTVSGTAGDVLVGLAIPERSADRDTTATAADSARRRDSIP